MRVFVCDMRIKQWNQKFFYEIHQINLHKSTCIKCIKFSTNDEQQENQYLFQTLDAMSNEIRFKTNDIQYFSLSFSI